MLPLRRQTAGFWLVTASPLALGAAFDLDFQPVNPVEFASTPTGEPFLQSNCNRPGQQINCSTNVSGGNSDETTPFLNELVEVDGVIYYHTIVGLPGDDFVQETYIQQGGRIWQGGRGTASEGDQNANRDPLSSDSSFTGTGTANVMRTLVRQVVGDMSETGDCDTGDGMCMQFLKDGFEMKPMIEQRLEIPDEMALTFVNDMRNKSFSDPTAIDPANNINRVEFSGPDAPGVGVPQSSFGDPFRTDGNFDIATDGQNLRITAGAYTWSPGSGPGQSGGTWTYFANGADAAPTDGFDPTDDIDWAAFYDPAQNTPWSFTENQP